MKELFQFLLPMMFFISLVLRFPESSSAQCPPVDVLTGKMTIIGNEAVRLRCSKKIQSRVKGWLSQKLAFPPTVFSVYPTEGDTILADGMVEIPSINSANPVSFKLRIVTHRKGYDYAFDRFYFDDISLSLEEWHRKNLTNNNENSEKNLNIVCKEVNSRVFLMLKDLSEQFNN